VEKRAAHYDLKAIKARVTASGMDVFTRTARDNARQMGLDAEAALNVVLIVRARLKVPTSAR
jgi:hypothetical protein